MIRVRSSLRVDAEQSYCAEVSHLGRKSAAEEHALIERIHAAERVLRDTLVTTGTAARHYLKLVRAIIAGDERLDRWIMERHVGDRDAFIAQLPTLANELAQRIEACSLACLTAVDAVNGGADIAWNEFTRQRGAVAELLAKFCFKTRTHTLAVPLLREACRHLNMLDTAEPEAVRDFQGETWLTPLEFLRATDASTRADAEAALARKALIESHLWLVIVIARSYPCAGMSFLDQIQEGNLGLMRAAEMHEGTGECKFSSYASWWIRQSITRAMSDQARLIRLPVYLSATVGSMLRVQRQLGAVIGREPTTEEVAEELHIPSERVREIMSVMQPPLSLQSKAGPDSDSSELGELIEDPRSIAPDQGSELYRLGDKLHEVLDPLNDQERMVLTQRYGLIDNVNRSMEEVARLVNLSKQRIHQIETRAMKKLRHPKRLRLLNQMLGRAVS